jgi:hypothetical protein
MTKKTPIRPTSNLIRIHNTRDFRLVWITTGGESAKVEITPRRAFNPLWTSDVARIVKAAAPAMRGDIGPTSGTAIYDADGARWDWAIVW